MLKERANKGEWGCEIEMWLENDVSYSTESRNPD